jgi:hypothetical protein
LRPAAGGGSEIGHLEDGSAGMDPARRLDDLARLAVGLVQPVVSAKASAWKIPA